MTTGRWDRPVPWRSGIGRDRRAYTYLFEPSGPPLTNGVTIGRFERESNVGSGVRVASR